jgi:hypothetical protein
MKCPKGCDVEMVPHTGHVVGSLICPVCHYWQREWNAPFPSKPSVIEDTYVAEAMKEQGGSFVKGLGELFFLADPYNRELIKATWPEYWGQYLALAVQREKDKTV